MLKEIAAQMQAVIQAETGAVVEVSFGTDVLHVYAETEAEIAKLPAVVDLLKKVERVGDVVKDIFYPADEDGPEGRTIHFALLGW